MLDCGVVTRQTTLASEGHEVWGFVVAKEPVLVSPVLACGSNACLCLINNEWNTVSSSKSPKPLEEPWCGQLASKSTYWLHNDSSHLAPGSS